MSQKIKVMPFLQKKGNRVAKGSIEFSDGVLEGFQLVGFTICDDKEKGLFVLFPSSIVKREDSTKPYFFLRPSADDQLDRLQNAILDIYESMTGFNRPHAPAVVNAAS
jgi:hypothetical protein